MTYFIVFILQILFTVIRHMSIRYVVDGSILKRLVITAAANLIWLLTAAIGVGSLISGDYLVILPYILGSLVGVLLEDKMRGRW